MIETRLGKYELIAELGHGGMADVFLAIARGPAGLGFNKLLVIKRLREHLQRDNDFVSMLVDEARIAARLNHPNVVQTVEIGNVKGEYFLAMEYLDGQPLRRILSRAEATGGMPAGHLYVVISDMLAGLHHAHELLEFDGTPLSIVHRDVSPHNVFITYEGQVKIVDFGIAKAVGRISETRHGVIKGKAPYMAPEQALGAPIDRRADIFSAGVMLWEAATGRRMWEGLSDTDVLRRLIRGQIPYSPIERVPDVPPRIDEICRKALAFVAENRYQTAEAMRKDVDEFLDQSRQRPSNRQLGEYVSGLFAQHREEARAIIEMRLAQLNAMSPDSLHAVPLQKLRPPGSTQDVTGSGSGISISIDEQPATATHAGTAATTTATVSSAEGRALDAIRGFRARRFAAFSALAVAALLVAAWAMIREEYPHPGAVAQPQASATPAPAMSQGDVFVILRAEPPQARLSIDNGPLLENPYSGRYPRDGAEHTIHAEAAGYVTKAQKVRFDDDVSIRFSLARGVSQEPSR